jgi:hypothetical protein
MKLTEQGICPLALPGLVMIWLSACGGSGSGYTAPQENLLAQPPPPVSYPAPPEPFSIDPPTLSASSDGNSYTGTYTEAPNNGTTVFDGQEANSSAISLTISENGSPIITEDETVYYLENPYQPLGMTLSYNGVQYDFLYTSTTPMPAMLTIGDSGPLGSGIFYAPNTNNAVGSLTQTYTVTSNGNFVFLNINATGTAAGQSINQTISYVINAGTAIGIASADVLVNGTTLHFNSACEGCWDY